jgi:serine/threonine-protein kinase HipA
VGRLARLGDFGSTFVYDEGVGPENAVSLSLPVRTQSWDSPHELLPIFDMNLPEGALRETLRLRFAKALGSFDSFGLLRLTGNSQIGRLRYTEMDKGLDESVPFQSVREILAARRDGELFEYLINQFAAHSGVAGVQPKVLFRGEDEANKKHSLRTATHIVKFWEETSFPELAANEFFCLSAARKLGLDVPDFELSDDGGALVIERFDIRNGKPWGFEDLAALNGRAASRKYDGGFETAVFKRVREFVDPAHAARDLEATFKLFVLNVALRNGDAHLKNWGVLYENATAPVRLAPVYDVVTTTAYLPEDMMALSLNGSKRFPDVKALTLLGQTRAFMHKQQITRVFEETADVLASLAPEVATYFAQSEHPRIGEAMLRSWQSGVASLGQQRDYVAGFSAAALLEARTDKIRAGAKGVPAPAEIG